MRLRGVNGGVLCLIGLIALIAFSATSVAGDTSDRIFHSVMGFLFVVRTHRHSLGLLHFIAEKGVHLALFTALGLLLIKVLPEGRWKIPVILVIALMAGVTSEWLQSFFPGRDPTLRDVIIDFCGAVCGLVLYEIFDRRARKTRPQPRPPGLPPIWITREPKDENRRQASATRK